MHHRHLKRKLIPFNNRKQLLHYLNQLPKDLRMRCEVFKHCNILSFYDDDYHHHETCLKRNRVKAEDNLDVKIHADTVPWGEAFIQAPYSWRYTTGRGIRIGVIDTGISPHVDLRARLAQGINTVDNTSPFSDQNGHGTHVSGTIAASLNGVGVVGAAPRASLWAIKAFDSSGSATIQDIVEGLEWAIEKKLDLLNMSFGSNQYSLALDQAIQAAARAGIMMVASAGNDGREVDFPARLNHVIAVGAINKRVRVANFSSRGTGLDFVEPGVDILSTWPGNSYMVLSGTSMAAPHMVGIIALIKAYYPLLPNNRVEQLLVESAKRIPNVPVSTQGNGYVRMRNVIRVTSRYSKVLRKYR